MANTILNRTTIWMDDNDTRSANYLWKFMKFKFANRRQYIERITHPSFILNAIRIDFIDVACYSPPFSNRTIKEIIARFNMVHEYETRDFGETGQYISLLGKNVVTVQSDMWNHTYSSNEGEESEECGFISCPNRNLSPDDRILDFAYWTQLIAKTTTGD